MVVETFQRETGAIPEAPTLISIEDRAALVERGNQGGLTEALVQSPVRSQVLLLGAALAELLRIRNRRATDFPTLSGSSSLSPQYGKEASL
jgi:hypothetical protein